MWLTLTRRRVVGACLLFFGASFLGIGAWQQSAAILVLGVAWWVAALVGLGVLMIQRINAVMQLSTLNRTDIQQLSAAKGKSAWLLRKCLKQTANLSTQLKTLREAQAKDLKSQVRELDRLSSNLDGLCSQFASDQSIAATWHQDHSKQVVAFRQQFGDFVASVAEWIALAEAQAKQSVAELAEREASVVEAAREDLVQRLENVDGELSIVRRATEAMPGAIAANGDQIDAINDAVVAVQQASGRMNETAAAASEQIKTMSKTVQAILPAQRTEIARAKIESVKEMEAILQLQTFLTPDKPMPLLGGWAMEPVSMLGVVNELVARQPQLVLECGSGTSTLWIAKALKRIGKGRLVSLEHLEEHHAATSRALLAADLGSWVDLHLVPLRTHRIGKEKFEWYDLARIDLPAGSVDFLLIDGPPQSTGPFARYPALPLLERLLAHQAVIVLDDADRPEEAEEVARWLQEYPGFEELGELGERTKVFTFSSSGSQERSAHLQAL